MKIADAFEEFVAYATLERCLETNTIYWYKRCVRPFIKYLRYNALESTLDNLSVKTLRAYFISHRQRGNAPRSIVNAMQGMRSFCNFLVKRGHLPENPLNHIEKPKISRRLPEFLDEKESRELLLACINLKRMYKSRWSRDVAIIALFLYAGLRRKELLNLTLNDLNLEKSFIKVFAKNKERIVPLNETARDFIADYLKVRPKRDNVPQVFVSTNRKQSALTEQGLYDLFNDLRKQIHFNKKITPQILRHTFCTLMLRGGVNIRDIQLLVGHADISTTARFYLGCDEKQLKGAIDKHPLNLN